MPPFMTLTTSVRGLPASRKGIVTRSGVSCPRSSVPSAAPSIPSFIIRPILILFLPVLYQYIAIQRVKTQLGPAAPDADAGHPILAPDGLSIHVLRWRGCHRERRHSEIGVHAAIEGLHLHVGIQAGSERHIQRSI